MKYQNKIGAISSQLLLCQKNRFNKGLTALAKQRGGAAFTDF
jgi:hypothetical protein